MKLIALLAGLLIERLATQLFHLRQLRRLDSAIDDGFRFAARSPGVPPMIAVVVLVLILAAPLLLALYLLSEVWFGVVYLAIAVLVLFFSLGPKDIGEQVDDYCEALEQEDDEAVRRSAKALLERDVPDDEYERIVEVEQAVCVQANNRLFAVVFWFVLLGPVGAWTYRVTDLIRRRAVFSANRDDDGEAVGARYVTAASDLHGWLAWLPARLTALGYALAGSFDSAISAWRQPSDEQRSLSLREANEDLLARVGIAALHLRDEEDESASARGIRGAMAANGLVFRLLGIWAVAIAALTLYGWAV